MARKTLGDVADYINGRAFKPIEWETTGKPIIRIQNLTNSSTEINRTTKTFEEKYSVRAGDLLFAWSASLGAYIWNGEDGWLNQHIFKVIPKKDISKKYLYYYLLHVVDQLYAKAHGSGMVHITIKPFKATTIPLPPLPEQRRIVDRIESLFAKLDEAKQKVQDALDSFETRKAAILHKAFTGELTAPWRKEHDVEMESWITVSVSEICHSLKYGTAKKSESEGAVVVIRMGNLQDGEIDWSDLAYSNDKEDIEKYKLMPGDVLFNRTNSPALVGKTSIYRGEYPAIYAGYLIKLDYDHSRITGDYLNYSLNTISAKEYCNSVKTDGVNQSNINAKKIGAYKFAMPNIEEQTEIVRILHDLLAKEQQAKEATEAVLEQIDLMKKSILARAFRGELGTNNLAEESAVELVRNII
ncbi:MAG TPA: restriction endonuclease subunit S [Candidatus Eubacterium pullicola]|nr:restriction endonuclease subunit S [Candidatus Eubacterium pullicola]